MASYVSYTSSNTAGIIYDNTIDYNQYKPDGWNKSVEYWKELNLYEPHIKMEDIQYFMELIIKCVEKGMNYNVLKYIKDNICDYIHFLAVVRELEVFLENKEIDNIDNIEKEIIDSLQNWKIKV
jgi:hypothetical protein